MTSNKGVALITGASRGIGRAIAIRLAKDGYNIALNDLPSALVALENVKEEIVKLGLGREVVICMADVTKDEEVGRMVEEVGNDARLGGLYVMVANAGICKPKPFLETTLDDWNQSFDVNAKGVYLCYRHAAKKMIEQGRGGRIIGACSIAGKQGYPLFSLYCATKFCVKSLTQSVASELVPYHITVNAYAPGYVRTSLLDQIRDDLKAHGGLGDSVDPDKIAQPEHIAGLVSYLVSEDAKHITGQSASVNPLKMYDGILIRKLCRLI